MEDVFDLRRAQLSPRQTNSLNLREQTVQHRKRSSLDSGENSAEALSFNAVAVDASQIRQPLAFVPITTVLRAHIPLSWLANNTSSYIRAGTVLRACISSVSRWEYNILVARLSSTNFFFAFEQVDTDTYVCFPLQRWITLQRIQHAAIGAAQPVDLSTLLDAQYDSMSHSRQLSSTSVGNNVEATVPGSPKIPKNRRGHLARLSILDSREKAEEPLTEVQPDIQLTETTDSPYQAISCGVTEEKSEVPPQLDVQTGVLTDRVEQNAPIANLPDNSANVVDHLSAEHLRCQYLETLYLAKTSLAFYAKGPLSRARARARAHTTSRTLPGLADFYRDCILPTRKLDLKYKESVQNRIGILINSDKEASNQTSKAKRKAKKTKLGKDGIWPLEFEYIERWWKTTNPTSRIQCNSAAQNAELNRAVSQLRMRETEMQIILMLEILSLERTELLDKRCDRSTDMPEAIAVSVEHARVEPLPNEPDGKKQRDLKMELESLVDRLCIWHSVQSEDNSDSSESLQKVKDRLRDFCKDVIVPFYSGKLPEQCHALCIKMGGASFSPRRMDDAHIREAIRPTPGTAIQDRPSKKRNLERVLSEDQTVRSASPSVLSRSATLPMPIPIKREPSERPTSRSRMQKSVSFNNREVDLVADAKATAAKRQKLNVIATRQRELDEAIETLKRPNRTMVAKNFMDDMEHRTKDCAKAMKKAEPIQISATPKRGAARQLWSDDYDLPPMLPTMAALEATTIPSSTVKPRGLNTIKNSSRSSDKKRAVLAAIHDTPFRAIGPQFNSALTTDGTVDVQNEDLSATLGSTNVASTPATARSVDVFGEGIVATPLRMKRSLRPVLFTPMRRSEISIEQAFRDAPEIPARAGKTMDRVMGSKADADTEISLYDSLGWNDDEYDL